jgi:hypothetical protein
MHPMNKFATVVWCVLLASASGCSGAAAEPDLLALKNWQIKDAGGELLLTHADKTVAPFPLFSDGGMPKLLACAAAKEDGRIGLLTYDSGSAGTSQVYDFKRVVVIDLRQKKILGIVLKSMTPGGDAPALRQPEWMWSKGRLTVRDREYGGETTLTW